MSYYSITTAITQNTINRLQNWADKTGFKFSTDKAEFIIVSRNHSVINKNTELTLNHQPIKRDNTINILGMTIDIRASWIPRIRKLKSDSHKRLQILKVLESKKWGADTCTLLNIYKCLKRPKLDYGSILYDYANSTILNTLDPIQNIALRRSLGVFKTSPTSSLEAETGIPPVTIRRK